MPLREKDRQWRYAPTLGRSLVGRETRNFAQEIRAVEEKLARGPDELERYRLERTLRRWRELAEAERRSTRYQRGQVTNELLASLAMILFGTITLVVVVAARNYRQGVAEANATTYARTHYPGVRGPAVCTVVALWSTEVTCKVGTGRDEHKFLCSSEITEEHSCQEYGR